MLHPNGESKTHGLGWVRGGYFSTVEETQEGVGDEDLGSLIGYTARFDWLTALVGSGR